MQDFWYWVALVSFYVSLFAAMCCYASTAVAVVEDTVRAALLHALLCIMACMVFVTYLGAWYVYFRFFYHGQNYHAIYHRAQRG